MIIKLIPETQAEKDRHNETTIEGVKEFFLMGNRNDEDGYLIDFHEWEGSYKYLLTSLHWFYNVIDEERKGGEKQKKALGKVSKPKMVKRGEVKEQDIGFIKRPFTFTDSIPENNKNNNQEEAFPENED